MKFLKPKFWDKNKLSIFSIILLPITILVKIIIFIRVFLLKSCVAKIPIICVGNIYIGGTGKTPLCIELFSILKSLGKKPAFIRKKYNKYEDELKLLNKVGPVYENKKRIKAINSAIQENANVAILDDGFQDFKIKKNLSIICFNEEQWIGNGFTIPSGPLREGLHSLKRASCVVINGKKNPDIENIILKINNLIKIFYSMYIPQNIDQFKNNKIICFAGIGNPVNFFNLLKNNNINIFEEIIFPDHYTYVEKDLEIMIKKAEENNATLLTTEKDYLRIDKNYKEKINYLKIKVEIENKNEFIEEIKNFI